MKNLKETSIYIHIPFCDHKCIYCDFYSITNYKNIENYLNALKKEIEYISKLHAENRIITTIFFGGGTPSFMTPEYIAEILICLQNKFKVSDDVEITLETNPGTVNKTILEQFLKIGINRLSIGIQSFDEDDLKFLTRIHDKQTALKTVENAFKAGFNNINIDLIFNLPNQTKEKWLLNLETAISLPIKHISAYSLILEHGTILNKMVLDGKIEIADENFDAELFEITMKFLNDNSFKQYEVSNFAKEGFECEHNKAYWEHKDYLAFGTSAHSFINGTRYKNLSSLNLYIASIEAKGNAIANLEVLESHHLHDEFIMLSLRSSGLKLNEFKQKFNYDFYRKNKSLLNKLVDEEYAEYNNNILKLTPKGYLICDEIIMKLL